MDVLADHLRADDRLLDVGAGAGRFSIPLAQRIREVLALEPSPSMSAALLADAQVAGVSNITLVPSTWEDAPADLVVDVAFSAHVVYSLARIEEFLQFLDRVARRWVAVAFFGGPAQSRLQAVWKAVYGEERLSNSGLPELLGVLWALERYPDVTMLDVPPWPLGNAERAPTRAGRPSAAEVGHRALVDIALSAEEDRLGQFARGVLNISWRGTPGQPVPFVPSGQSGRAQICSG